MPRAPLNTMRVVTAAIRRADRHGLQALTLAAVAADLGVRVPSLYKHVDGVPELKRRMSQRVTADLGRELLVLRAARDQATDRRPDARMRAAARELHALALGFRTWAQRRSARYDLLYRCAPAGEGGMAPEADPLRQQVADLLVGYDLSGAATAHAERAVCAALHGFIALERSGMLVGSAAELDENYRRVVRALDVAIRGGVFSGDAFSGPASGRRGTDVLSRA